MAADTNIMGWDDVLENDGQEFVILPEGDYTYTVTNLVRGQFPGGPKLPACPKATLTLTIDNDLGPATAWVDLMLYRTMEWKISSFFRSIGQKKHGEKVVMNWGKVVGARGRAHFRPCSYESKNGVQRQRNEVDRFIDYTPDVALTPVNNADLPWGEGGF